MPAALPTRDGSRYPPGTLRDIVEAARQVPASVGTWRAKPRSVVVFEARR